MDLDIVYVRADAQALAGAYRSALTAQGAPFPTGSILAQYLVYRAAREHGVRVMLGGQGGDEIFMGYRKYELFHLRQLVHRRRTWEALAFFASLVPEVLAETPRLSWYWRLRHRYTRSSGLATALDLPDTRPCPLDFDSDQPLWMRQLADIHHASLPTLLRYEDRSSMANSVESRLPYLDYPLVEFALALPVSFKLRDGYRKWILRAFARGRIPEAIRVARFKRSFDVEQESWIRGGLGSSIRQALHDGLPAARAYLKRGEMDVERLFSDDRLSRDPAAFGEATTLLWLADVAQGVPVPPAEAGRSALPISPRHPRPSPVLAEAGT
jgi:asparagine synthase (glutamine-hydrolysing)